MIPVMSRQANSFSENVCRYAAAKWDCALRHEEEDFDLSPADRRGSQQIALGLLVCLLSPAIYMNLRFAFPAPFAISWAGAIFALIAGFPLADV